MGNKLDTSEQSSVVRDEIIKIIFSNYKDYEIYHKMPNNSKMIAVLSDLTNYKNLNEFQKFKIGDYKDDRGYRRRYQYKRLGTIRASYYVKFSKFDPENYLSCHRCGKNMKLYSQSGDTYDNYTGHCLVFICQDKNCGMWYKEEAFAKCIIF
jgi:hypothetical protein